MKHIVQDWMSSPVVVIPPEVSIDQALTLMRRRGISSLVVDLARDDGSWYGMITDTDIHDTIVGQDCNPSTLRVAEIMSSPVECAEVDWTLRQAARAMQEMDVHYLPVEDERATLVGVISATDIFMAVEEVGWDLVS